MCSSITEYPNGFPIQIEWEYTKKPNPNQTFYHSPFTIININLIILIFIYISVSGNSIYFNGIFNSIKSLVIYSIMNEQTSEEKKLEKINKNLINKQALISYRKYSYLFSNPLRVRHWGGEGTHVCEISVDATEVWLKMIMEYCNIF